MALPNFNSPEGLCIYGWPVADAALKGTQVNKIERVWLVRPFKLRVIELKLEVWWNPGWLDGRQICTYNFR